MTHLTGIPQSVKTIEERDVLDGLNLDFQWNLVQSSFSFHSRRMLLAAGGGGGQRTHFLEKHTAFDQSLVPLSAVVKGCVTCGPNVEADECGRGLIQPGGRGGACEVVPVVVESVGPRQG